MLVDTHVHLDLYKDLSSDVLVEEALQNEINLLVTVGINLKSSKLAVEFAQKHPEVYAIVGVHPHYASQVNLKTIEELKKLASYSKVVGIGEIGLDYYRDLSPRDVQKRVFRELVDLALGESLPFVIHNRDASEDILKILKETSHLEDRFLVHCFSGGLTFLKEVLKMGGYVSIGGPVTFKNAHETVEVVKAVPISRLILETDSPFLAPHPHRGKLNKPSFSFNCSKNN